MREPAWMTKYQAREALKNGRPEDAHRMVDSLMASGDKKAYALKGDVVRGYIERGERSLRNDDIEGAWRDLNNAGPIATPSDPLAMKLRDSLVRLAIAEMRAMLEAGKPLEVIEAITLLKERPADSPALPGLELAAKAWQSAIDHACTGATDVGPRPLRRKYELARRPLSSVVATLARSGRRRELARHVEARRRYDCSRSASS
jgi:hypothetical protein